MYDAKILNGGLSRGANQCVADLSKYPLGTSIMDVCVGSGQIAQRFEDSAGLGFHNKPGVLIRGQPVTGDGESEFEGHILCNQPDYVTWLFEHPGNTASSY